MLLCLITSDWQLAGWPLGTMEAKTGLHTRVLGMPRRLDPQLGLHTGVRVCPGVWIPKRGYVQAFGSPTAATHGCLESQPRLHTGVWSPKRAIVQVASCDWYRGDACSKRSECDHCSRRKQRRPRQGLTKCRFVMIPIRT